MSSLPVVDCRDCGVCCLHMGYPAFNLPREQLAAFEAIDRSSLSPVARADLDRWRAMPQPLRADILQRMDDYRPPRQGELDGPCVWLDPESRVCRHHSHRPQVCRDFAVGGAGCLEWRDALLMANESAPAVTD